MGVVSGQWLVASKDFVGVSGRGLARGSTDHYSPDDVAGGDAGHLVEGGDAGEDLAPAVVAQGDHAVLERLVADGRGVDALDDHLAEVVAGDHQLEDALPPAEAGLAAGPAAGALEE